MQTSYESKIVNRTFYSFFRGLIARIPRFIYFKLSISIAKRNGAHIGKNVCLIRSFAKQINKNVTIGDNVSINTCKLSSSQFKIDIGNNVIIGNNVNFLMSSHDIDSPQWEHCRRSTGLVIEDYVWICPHSIILPSVKRIGRGAVIGAGSVVVNDVDPMTVVGGNPAKVIKKRSSVHSELCVESLLGGDLISYIRIWTRKSKLR